MTQAVSLTRIHALAYPLGLNPNSRKLAEETDYDAYVVGLIKQILLTAPGERINRPEFGVGVKRLIFAAGPDTAHAFTKALVLEGLTKHLKDIISVEAIGVRSEEASLFIDINYVVLQRGHRRYLNLEVTL
jgi:uncharacterized protein